MEFNFSYQKDSSVESDANATQVSFAPDTQRQPTYFSGKLRQNLGFREAISALHDVVVSDLRWHPKDRTEYKEWRARQDELDWVEVAAQQQTVAEQVKQVRAELNELRQRSAERMKPFYAARARYFNYLYQRDYNAWFVLDPVITVHPDSVFFECFSMDESSYGRLDVGYEVFKEVGEFACGTTNIDYSSALYDEFQKVRSYKETHFEIDPSGFEVQTGAQESYKEVKIDLPDSWVRGFLQVSSAMALPAVQVSLHPMDVHNICFVLRRNRELIGPRSMRYQLKPGHPVKIVFDPWNLELECPRSLYEGSEEAEIRVWGRRRIHILERLIPIARRFTVHLLGQGMPSFYVADLGDMKFTLGLSGWTSNDWAASGNFDLLAPRATVDSQTAERVFAALQENWMESPDSLAARLDLDRAEVLGALAVYTQAGRAIWDLNQRVYRVRELSREPLPMELLRFSNDREEQATALVEQGRARIKKSFVNSEGVTHVEGVVQVKPQAKTKSRTRLALNADQRITDAECSCNWYQQNRLRKGPCECILALRLAHSRQSRNVFDLQLLL